MTVTEMSKRIKQLGGLNDKNALIITVEKYIHLKSLWKIGRKAPKSLVKGGEHRPTVCNCTLCQLHAGPSMGGSCGSCPLVFAGQKCFEWGNTFYLLWDEGAEIDRRDNFYTGCNQIIDECRKALKGIKNGK